MVENIYLWIIYFKSDGKALFQVFFSYYRNSSWVIQCEFLPFHDLLLFRCAKRWCSTDTGNTELSTKDFLSANPLIKNAVTSRKCEVLLYFMLPPCSSSGTMHFYREAILKLFLVTMFLITWQGLHLFQLTKNSPKQKCYWGAGKGGVLGELARVSQGLLLWPGFYNLSPHSPLPVGPYLTLQYQGFSLLFKEHTCQIQLILLRYDSPTC